MRRSFLSLFALIVATSCGGSADAVPTAPRLGSPYPGPPPPAPYLEIITPTALTLGSGGHTVVLVRALDASGAPIEFDLFFFRQNGSDNVTAVMGDEDGFAHYDWQPWDYYTNLPSGVPAYLEGTYHLVISAAQVATFAEVAVTIK